MTTFEIKFKNLPLEVTGIYYASDLESEFEIHKVELCGHSVFDLIDNKDGLNELENEILTKFY